MSQDLGQACTCFGCYDENEIVGFIGAQNFPCRNSISGKRIETISRLCVLPDYQGIGIGRKFLTEVAKIYAAEGKDVKITTSAKNLICALRRDPRWKMTRYGKTSLSGKTAKIGAATHRYKAKTATFFYTGEDSCDGSGQTEKGDRPKAV